MPPWYADIAKLLRAKAVTAFILGPHATQIARSTGVYMLSDSSPPDPSADDALAGEPEPWESWETSLVLASIAAGAVGLVVLGWLVARFILP
jgi:hypothetical protein